MTTNNTITSSAILDAISDYFERPYINTISNDRIGIDWSGYRDISVDGTWSSRSYMIWDDLINEDMISKIYAKVYHMENKKKDVEFEVDDNAFKDFEDQFLTTQGY